MAKTNNSAADEKAKAQAEKEVEAKLQAAAEKMAGGDVSKIPGFKEKFDKYFHDEIHAIADPIKEEMAKTGTTMTMKQKLEIAKKVIDEIEADPAAVLKKIEQKNAPAAAADTPAAAASAAPAAATTPATAPATKPDTSEDAGMAGMFDPSKGMEGMKEVFKMLMGLFQGLFTGNFDKMGDLFGNKGTEDKAAAEAAAKTKAELVDAEKRQAAAKAELSEISGKLAEIEAGKVATAATTEEKKASAPAPTPPSDGKTLSDKALKEKLDNLGYNQTGIDKIMADPTAKSTLAKDLATPGLSDNAAIERVGVAMDNMKNKDAAVAMASTIVAPPTVVSKFAGTSIAAHDGPITKPSDIPAPAPTMGPITKPSQVSAPTA